MEEYEIFISIQKAVKRYGISAQNVETSIILVHRKHILVKNVI